MTLHVRCPSGKHTVDLHDDLAGARVRCPICGQLFFVDAAMDTGAFQAASPPPVKDAERLSERLYDGLPPLSVMIALRRQDRGAEHEAKLEMTEDDWRALDAYESALIASYSLRTSALVCGVVALLALPLAIMAVTKPDPNPAGSGVLGSAAMGGLILLFACCVVIYFGSIALRKIRLEGALEYLSWAICISIGVFAGLAGLGIFELASLQYAAPNAFGAIVCTPFSGLAIFDLARSGWRARLALKQIAPPEITNRLVEALNYLE